jgi:uncharacterized membrane protein
MTKQEFLKNLREELERHKVQNVTDILADYEEHFDHGLSKGKSEEKIALGLGFPSTIAKAYKTEHMINEIKDPAKGFQLGLMLSVIGRLIVIAPFNFLVLFIPGIVIFAILAGGWGAAVGIGSAGLAAFSIIPSVAELSTTAWAWVATICTGLGLLGMALVTGMLMFVFSKYILLSLISYLQWNIKFVTQK